jgi:hypothetical protein
LIKRIHGFRKTVREDRLDTVGGTFTYAVPRFGFFAVKFTQDIVVDRPALRRATDADTYTNEVCLIKMAKDRLDTAMSARRTAIFEAKSAERQVHIVRDNDDVLCVYLLKTRDLADSLTA